MSHEKHSRENCPLTGNDHNLARNTIFHGDEQQESATDKATTTTTRNRKRTTTDGSTAALSIIQYYSLSKSEKPDILVGGVDLRSRDLCNATTVADADAVMQKRSVSFS